MKKAIIVLVFVFSFSLTNAQKKSTEKVKDTVKTEVVNVISSYTPTIADAFKLKKNPEIKFTEKSKKKPMEYTIFPTPVASTFVPKTGIVKGINVGVKEKLFNNYIALGFGNFTTPFAELFLQQNIRFQKRFGVYAKYISSEENSISDTFLNSTFSNFESSVYYGQKQRVFDWKVTFNSERNTYNWYGLPEFISNPMLKNTINEEQRYNFFELIGDLNFDDSYIEKSSLKLHYFSDALASKELVAKLATDFAIPFDYFSFGENQLKLKTSLEFLNGKFKKNYEGLMPIDYSIFTIGLHPEYNINLNDFAIKAGFKFFTSIDAENSSTNFLVYPDVAISTPIVLDYISLYAGASGGLTTNSYKSFTDENPFVSPTLFITQTSETYNLFLGFNGKLTQNFNFNIKGSYQQEEDKPLFIRNNSKSDGTNTVDVNNIALVGYEYGNSYTVLYDDVKTTTIFTEFEYTLSENTGIGITGLFNNFKLKNTAEAWNLPNLTASVFGKYKSQKWYAETAIFYVGDRKSVGYTDIFPAAFSKSQTIDGYIDVNLNGGYHFTDRFSTFLKLNNILNANYQRFNNFTVQGFQVLGGFTYKFDF